MERHRNGDAICPYLRTLRSVFLSRNRFSPDDLDNHARLVQRTNVPVATGEIEAGRWRFKEILEKGAATILQPDAICCGGITEFRRIAATAASYGVSVAPHAYHEMHVHIVASTPNATFIEVFNDDTIVNFRRLIDTQPVVENGRVLLPQKPGLGYDYLPDVIDKYANRPLGLGLPKRAAHWPASHRPPGREAWPRRRLPPPCPSRQMYRNRNPCRQ